MKKEARWYDVSIIRGQKTINGGNDIGEMLEIALNSVGKTSLYVNEISETNGYTIRKGIFVSLFDAKTIIERALSVAKEKFICSEFERAQISENADGTLSLGKLFTIKEQN